jgi:TetR/AcrR family transcriptional regulator, transcriptional repressor for nem operon
LEEFRNGRLVHGCPFGRVSLESNKDDEWMAEIRKIFEHWHGSLRRVFKSELQRGRLRPGTDPEGLSWYCLCALEGGLLLARLRGTAQPLATAVNEIKFKLVSRKGTRILPKQRSAVIGYCP